MDSIESTRTKFKVLEVANPSTRTVNQEPNRVLHKNDLSRKNTKFNLLHYQIFPNGFPNWVYILPNQTLPNDLEVLGIQIRLSSSMWPPNEKRLESSTHGHCAWKFIENVFRNSLSLSPPLSLSCSLDALLYISILMLIYTGRYSCCFYATFTL